MALAAVVVLEGIAGVVGGGNYRGCGGQNSRGSGVRSVAAAAGIKSRSKKGREKTSQQIADELVQRGRTLAIEEARESAKKHDRGKDSDEDEEDAPGSAASMVTAIFGKPKKKNKTFMMRMKTVPEDDALDEMEEALETLPTFGNMNLLALMDMSMSGFDTCSGGSVSTDEKSFMWLDKRESTIAGHGVQGVGKGGMDARGFGPKVRAVPMTGSGRLKLMIDPRGMCLKREQGDPHIDVFGGIRMQNLGLPLKMDHEENEGLNVLKDRFTDETVKIESQGGLLMMRGAKFNVKQFVEKHGVPKLQEICGQIARGERSALVDVADIDNTDKVMTDVRRLTEKSQMSRGNSRKKRRSSAGGKNESNSEGLTPVQANAQKKVKTKKRLALFPALETFTICADGGVNFSCGADSDEPAVSTSEKKSTGGETQVVPTAYTTSKSETVWRKQGSTRLFMMEGLRKTAERPQYERVDRPGSRSLYRVPEVADGQQEAVDKLGLLTSTHNRDPNDDFVKEVDKLLVGGMQGQVECKEKVVECDGIRQNELTMMYLVLTMESRGYVHQRAKKKSKAHGNHMKVLRLNCGKLHKQEKAGLWHWRPGDLTKPGI